MWKLVKNTSIKMFSEYVELLKEGKKKTTIRYKKDCIRYPESILYIYITNSKTREITDLWGPVLVGAVIVKRIDELTEYDAKRDGFSSLEELKTELSNIYGYIRNDELVSIYELRLI